MTILLYFEKADANNSTVVILVVVVFVSTALFSFILFYCFPIPLCQSTKTVLDVLSSYRLEQMPSRAARAALVDDALSSAAAEAAAAAAAAAGGEGEGNGNINGSNGGKASGDVATYFAKYLTSPKLLDLELADASFRRQVRKSEIYILFSLSSFIFFSQALLQFLILFQYLTGVVSPKLRA